MLPDLRTKVFTDANQEVVPYHGEPVSWRVSVYALVQAESNLLIIKNDQEKLFDVPGGGVEFGETLLEALQRECLEEAGLTITNPTLLHTVEGYFFHSNEQQFYQTLQLFFTADQMGKLTQPTEQSTVFREYVSLAEIGKKYPLPPGVEESVSLL